MTEQKLGKKLNMETPVVPVASLEKGWNFESQTNVIKAHFGSFKTNSIQTYFYNFIIWIRNRHKINFWKWVLDQKYTHC